MERLKRMFTHVSGTYSGCPKDCPLVRFTGDSPRDATEELIVKAAGGRETVALDWLEERVADSLYRRELCRGGWAIDVGVWGPGVFREEAGRILSEMRHGFGLLVREEQRHRAPLQRAGSHRAPPNSVPAA